ncbi:hypothetical protein [Vibrio sp. F74]|uniref:hypothetical protein n=1 Tax=Vibrio sp. F74 TaxID=700020 RepID=UPI0035F5388A
MREKLKKVAVPFAMVLITAPALANVASPSVDGLKGEIDQLTAEVNLLKNDTSAIRFNGYYRLQSTVENLDETEDNSSTWVDQRLRMKVTSDLHDNVTVVWYGEYDAPFGETGSKTVAGSGGKLSSDGVGIETKNAYVDFRVPNTDWQVRTGIQGYGFGKYESFVTDDDMNGISFLGNVDMATLSGGWFKWDEGERESSDDVDFYTLNGELSPNDNLSYGFTGAMIKNRNEDAINGTAARTDEIYLGSYVDFSQGDIAYSGSVLYKLASGVDSNATDGDTFMLNLYAKKHWAEGSIKVHAIYIPADDSSNGTDRFAANQSGWELNSGNLMIFGTDYYYNNGSQGGKAVYDAAYQGYGLLGLMISGDQQLDEDYYLKYGVGYFSVADDAPKSTSQANGSSLGTELAAQFGKKFADIYDLSLRGSYGFMGDFYQGNSEDTYKIVAMLNVGF